MAKIRNIEQINKEPEMPKYEDSGGLVSLNIEQTNKEYRISKYWEDPTSFGNTPHFEGKKL